MPSSKACLWIAIDHFYGKKWGVAAIVCDTTGNSVTKVLLHLSRDRRGYFGRVTKDAVTLNAFGRRNTQMNTKERKRKAAKERKRAQKSVKIANNQV